MAVREIPELKADILKLKKQTGTAVLAHLYTDPDVQDIADACGDSLDMIAAAQRLGEKRIVVAGVYYTAETIAMLCPDKQIFLAHPQARCPMSGQIYPGRVRNYREEHPGCLIVTGLSASAQLKAECDLCVTRSNAVDVIRKSRASEILFASDCNIGEYLRENLPDVAIEAWNCSCPMMSSVAVQDVELARQKWSGAALAVNMSCRGEIRRLADMVGSAADIIRYCEAVDWDVMIADEVAVCQKLSRSHPERNFRQLAPSKLICSNMQINTLEAVERAIKGEFGIAAEPDPRCADAALEPVMRMLELSGEGSVE